MIEILHRYTKVCLYRSESAADLRAAVVEAVGAGANLAGANLARANLADANLADANLARANLADANLADANLADANLADANLADANLARANLAAANLADAYLAGANLARANLAGAYLAGAGVTLDTIRDDIYAVLAAAPDEAPGLLDAVRAGKIDGTAYQGDCACLVGTIAKVKGCDYREVPGLAPDATRPAERWFLNLRPGHLPTISIHAALTAAWIEGWLVERASQAVQPSPDHP